MRKNEQKKNTNTMKEIGNKQAKLMIKSKRERMKKKPALYTTEKKVPPS